MLTKAMIFALSAATLAVVYPITGSLTLENNHWGENGNVQPPISVSGEIRVSNGLALTIDAGTLITFEENAVLIVDSGSALYANGVDHSRILINAQSGAVGHIQVNSVYDAVSEIRFTNLNGVFFTHKSPGKCVVSNCIFFQSALHLARSNHAMITNNTIYQNATTAFLISDTVTNYQIRNNIFYGFGPQGISVSCSEFEPDWSRFSYNGKHGTLDSYTNCAHTLGEGSLRLIEKPFLNTEIQDFHIMPSSPTVDAGDPTSEYSLEPDCNGTNTRINMGAYGNTPEAACKQEASVGPFVLQRPAKIYGATNGAVFYDLRGRIIRSPFEEKLPQGLMVTEGLHGRLEIRNLIP